MIQQTTRCYNQTTKRKSLFVIIIPRCCVVYYSIIS